MVRAFLLTEPLTCVIALWFTASILLTPTCPVTEKYISMFCSALRVQKESFSPCRVTFTGELRSIGPSRGMSGVTPSVLNVTLMIRTFRMSVLSFRLKTTMWRVWSIVTSAPSATISTMEAGLPEAAGMSLLMHPARTVTARESSMIIRLII